MEMDDNLKRLMKQLGTAINESLCDSASVSQAMTDLRQAGYDIFVILEATIGFNRRPEEDAADREFTPVESGDLILNAQDAKFLKSLRICIGGSNPSPPEQS